MNIGVGVYMHMFDIPVMLSSPKALADTFANDLGQPQKFWIPLHALMFFSILFSLITNWNNPERKKPVLYAFIGYIYVSLISIYFSKELFAFKELPDAPEFYERTHRWLLLSWHRLFITLISTILLMTALTKPSTKNQNN